MNKLEAPCVSLQLMPIVRVWREVQTAPEGVIRYDKYHFDCEKRKLDDRVQNVLQHGPSVMFLAVTIMNRLQKYQERPIDQALVLKAFLVHDFGEGALNRDVAYRDHSKGDAVDEYHAFLKWFGTLGPELTKEFVDAYLLQEVGRNNTLFPEEPRAIIKRLEQDHMIEGLLFDAIEKWDYIQTGFEMLAFYDNPSYLTRILRNIKGRLKELSELVPGFREEIWTHELETWCEAFFETYDKDFPEPKALPRE